MGHRIAILQRDIVWQDIEANLKAIEHEVEGLDVDTVVLSEMFTTGFATDPRDVAEQEGGATLEWMKSLAHRLDAAVVGSVAVRVGDEYRNRMYFVKPSDEVEYYDKHHLFTIGEEGRFFTAGQSRCVVQWRGVRFLLQVCFDLRFPVWSRQRGDYDAIIYSALWPTPRRDVWQLLLRARAVENQAYVIGVNRTGNEPTLNYSGDSAVVDPYGCEQVKLDDKPGVGVAELNMDALARFREKFNVGRESDMFQIINE